MTDSPVFYAIGDIHGEASRLKDLHASILDFHAAIYPNRPKHVVCLGDYVDRGPNSKGVIDFLIHQQTKSPDAFTCLMGNHEQMMLSAINGTNEDLNFWTTYGGINTMESYGTSIAQDIPCEHISWMSKLPRIFRPEGTGLIFVHAGVHPVQFPNENSDVWIWTRSRNFFDPSRWESPELEGCRVVHGHTPTHDFEPEVTPDGRRINVDTGAAFGGDLTVAVIADEGKPIFLRA